MFLQGTQLWNKPESINGFYSRDPNLLRVLDAVVELLWSDEYVADTIVCGLEHKWLRPKRVTDALGEGMMRLRAEQGVYDELMGMVRNSLEPGAGGTKPT